MQVARYVHTTFRGKWDTLLFISHGGFASVTESVCHGVPTLMLPVSSDQLCNAARAVRLGIAELLTWDVLTADSLRSAMCY